VVISRRDATAIVADTFLLSCRVLGRGVEHRMLARVGELAREANLAFVEIPFIRTRKNQPVLDFLNSVAMDYRTSTPDGFLYRLPADFAAAIKATVATAAPDDSPELAGAREPSGDRAAQLAVYQRIADEWTTPAAILTEIESDRRRTRQDAGTFAAPVDPRQQEMAEIWQRVLGIDRIGIHDDYFKLGGTSLLAVRLVLEIEKTFARQLPIAVLLRAPTIEKLCGQLDAPAERDDLAIVTLRPPGPGGGPPLFLLPGIGGHVMSYRQLSELMEGTQAIHGMEMRPEIESNRRPRAMEQIADEFCGRLRTFQPEGPYLLAGWSFGGSLAFAMARQLQEAGQTVGLVALFDTFCHGYPAPVTRGEIIRRHSANLWRLSAAGKARYVAEKLSFTAGVLKHRTLRVLGVRKTDFHIYKVPEVEEMVAVCDAAWNAYQPTPLAGKLTLIRATHRPQRIGVSFDDPYNGWGALAGGGVEVYPIESGHMKLFEEPAVHAVAAALSTAYRQVVSVR
jgi:thioesterase domain-containing protein/acyl carrier protein